MRVLIMVILLLLITLTGCRWEEQGTKPLSSLPDGTSYELPAGVDYKLRYNNKVYYASRYLEKDDFIIIDDYYVITLVGVHDTRAYQHRTNRVMLPIYNTMVELRPFDNTWRVNHVDR